MSMWCEREKCCASCKHESLYEITSLWWKLHVFTSPNCTTPHVISGNVFFSCQFQRQEIERGNHFFASSGILKFSAAVNSSFSLMRLISLHTCENELSSHHIIASLFMYAQALTTTQLTARGLWIRTKNQTEREYRGKMSNEIKIFVWCVYSPKKLTTRKRYRYSLSKISNLTFYWTRLIVDCWRPVDCAGLRVKNSWKNKIMLFRLNEFLFRTVYALAIPANKPADEGRNSFALLLCYHHSRWWIEKFDKFNYASRELSSTTANQHENILQV